jgi:hypothetical protein
LRDEVFGETIQLGGATNCKSLLHRRLPAMKPWLDHSDAELLTASVSQTKGGRAGAGACPPSGPHSQLLAVWNQRCGADVRGWREMLERSRSVTAEASVMSAVKIDREEGLAALLPQTNQTIQEAARMGLIFAVRPLLEQPLRAGSGSHRSSAKGWRRGQKDVPARC